MNKKKRTTYLLIAVIVIYGAIIARFFMLSGDGSSSSSMEATLGSFEPTTYALEEEFEILNDYRDPFLGTLKRKTNPTPRSTGPVTIEKKNTYFPQIKYLGVISDTKSSQKVLSLQVNSKEYVIREGKVIDSVTVISGNRNELTVSYKGTRKVIKILAK